MYANTVEEDIFALAMVKLGSAAAILDNGLGSYVDLHKVHDAHMEKRITG